MPTLLKLFHNIETEGTLTNLFYEATVTVILNHIKTPQIKELQTNFPVEHRYKTLNEILAKPIKQTHKILSTIIR